MDQALTDLLQFGAPAASVAGKPDTGSREIRFLDPASGQVEVQTPEGPKAYQLKPLAELYGQGKGGPIETEGDHYLPLLLGIEQEIVHHDLATRGLSDGPVALTLERLGMNPEEDPGADPLAQRLQLGLRLILSLHDYSRQEVRQALRKIHKSVQRHTREGGPRGYLTFIRKYVAR